MILRGFLLNFTYFFKELPNENCTTSTPSRNAKHAKKRKAKVLLLLKKIKK